MPRTDIARQRLPANYQTVLEVVQEHARGRHLTREQVHALARRRQPRIGSTTVYRALVRLRDLGRIAEVTVPGAAQAFYEMMAQEHAHLRCDACGTILDVDFHLSPAVVAKIEKTHCVSVAASSISLRGLCTPCSTKGAARKM